LVAGEIGLSLVLLAGAGLLLRSFLRLESVDPGFNPAGILTFDLALPEIQYPDGSRVAAFSNDLLERMQSLPGVESAAVVRPAPLSGNDYSSSIKIKGQPPSPNDEDRSAEVRIVSRDYFRTMQIPVLRGRVFQTTDRRDAPPVVVISRNAEKRFFPSGDALGQEMSFDARIGYDKVGGQIVGIVGDVHDFGLELEPPPDAYVLQDQAGVNEMSVLIRTKGDPIGLSAAVREKVHGLDGDIPIAAMSTMETALGDSLAQRRFYMSLLGIFAAVAILLAAVGVYGVMAYSVSRRTQEIGIRLALGARHQQLLSLLMRQAALLVGTGLMLGLMITAASGRILAGLLFGIRASDPLILVSSTAGMALIALLAGYVPLRRVLKVDPMVALRYE
jgi:putative ABC transport system permease protein